MNSERDEETFELKVIFGKDEKKNMEKISQEQIHGLLFGEQLSWQQIIYDLINSEQLNPWDIDLVLLSNKYLDKVKELEEANLFVSSKVLFAASLLLRIKSEILLNEYLPNLDALLFGTKEEKKYTQERIELDEEIPGLIPRTPLPRFRKVTLQELIAALGKAVNTENRRIKRVVTMRQQEIETAIALPRRQINIQEKIKEVYGKLKKLFFGKCGRIAFGEVAGEKKDERVETFIPLLYLDTQHKVLLEQEKHLDEIWIWQKEMHEKKYKDELEALRKEVDEEFTRVAAEEELENEIKRAEELEKNKIKKEKKTKGKKNEREKNDDETDVVDDKIELTHEKVDGDGVE